MEVASTDDAWVGPATRVSIFLSPLDVHVNRAPMAGLVAGVEYRPGSSARRTSRRRRRINERCTRDARERAMRVAVRQIAGRAGPAHRVPGSRPGDKLEAGERYGLDPLRLADRPVRAPRGGSRVQVGDRVPGGRIDHGGVRDASEGREAIREAAASCARRGSRGHRRWQELREHPPPRHLPAAQPVDDRQPLLRLPRPDPHRRARFTEAAIAIFVAMVLDVLDGKVARLTKTTTQFGVEFDSLADVVSFCVAPAFMLYTLALSSLGRAAWLGRVPLRHLRRAPAGPVQRLLGRERPALLRRAAHPGGGGDRGLGGAAPRQRRDRAAGRAAAIAAGTYLVAILMVSTFRYYSFKEIDFARRRPTGVLLAGRAGRADRRDASAVVPLPAVLGVRAERAHTPGLGATARGGGWGRPSSQGYQAHRPPMAGATRKDTTPWNA